MNPNEPHLRSRSLLPVIDASMHFLPEHLTPLWHTPIYSRLSDPQRKRYNQLHGCYINEQIMFFEVTLAKTVLGSLLKKPLPNLLADGLREFIKQEERHTGMFRQLNRQCEPRLYAHQDFHFVSVPKIAARFLNWATRHPTLFPLFLWLMLLQEELAVFYSRQILKSKLPLEPHFQAVHRVHLADEIKHVRWDQELLELFWGNTSPLLRHINARLLGWMVAEFFITPKRAGLRVIEKLINEFPGLRDLRPEMRMQLFALRSNPAYHKSLYSRDIVPKTFACFDQWPEFRRLSRVLEGYQPKGCGDL